MNDPLDRPVSLRPDNSPSVAKQSSRPPICPEMTVRQIAADYPACREVLRRHGEPEDRAAKFGHLEPLDHFARRHNINLEQLLAELSQAAGVGVDRDNTAAQYIHRPFIASALAVTLTLGAAWGAWLLFEIGWHGQFEAASASHIVAHGEAQLWGFIALFVTGIALRYLPMGSREKRADRRFARLLLAAFLTGVIGGFVWALAPGQLRWLGPIGGAALFAASVLFLVFVIRQFRGNWRATGCRPITAAAVWMVIWAVTTLTLRGITSADGPGAYSESIRQLLMELAIFGFTVNAIYGFGQRLLSGIVGSATPRIGVLATAFWLHNLGVLLMALSHIKGMSFIGPLGVAVLAAAAFTYAAGMRGFVRVRRTTPRPEVGQGVLRRYVQLAFFWLLVSMTMLVIADLYWNIRGLDVPHTYLGAVRHALTVGFMTTLILGVGQRLLPILGHTLLAWPRLVLPTFLLIAVGNLLRVTTELMAPISTIAFVVMPYSALLELSALVLFAANALRTMWPAADPLLRSGRVTQSTSVAVLLAEYPALEDQLFAWGFGYVGRVRSVPRELTLGTLASGEGKDVEEIIVRINEQLAMNAEPRP